ncbi:MAG TPA: hypothetical protein VK125_08745 [Bacillota bacterium]|nr:hypothetical protein [Bacillota bacterium]
MFVDLFNHALLDSTFLYIYLGTFLIAFTVVYFSHMYQADLVDCKTFIRARHELTKVNMHVIEKPLAFNESFFHWFIIVFQRVKEADDDEDDSISYFIRKGKIRGGERWRKRTYSLTLSRTV